MTTDEVKKLPPVERLAYWIKEREMVRLLKEAGAPRPWTDDQILHNYRFCNVRRMDDKVSRWLMDNWYGPFKDHPNMVSAVGLARNFNLPTSLEPVSDHVFADGGPEWVHITNILKARRGSGVNVFNAAYIVSTNGRKMDKVDAAVGYARNVSVIQPDTSSMQKTHAQLMMCCGVASFMAGQIVADLRHALTGDWADRHDWAPIGPGSLRGLKRLYVGGVDGRMSQAEAQGYYLAKMRDDVFGFLPRNTSIRLEAMDYQSCMCEWDKYERALWGEGRPKQYYREVA